MTKWDYNDPNRPKVYAIDFDGTLCKSAYPLCGEPNQDIIDYCKYIQSKGHKLVLWTCRVGWSLMDAIQWCRKQGLEFDEVNATPKEIQEYFGNDTRKIFADVYLDDKNQSVQEVVQWMQYNDWMQKRFE